MTTARTADEATQFAANLRHLDILITDVGAAGAGGKEVAEGVIALHPAVRVLYVSEDMADAVARDGHSRDGDHFLQKPFTPASLAAKVGDVLGGHGLASDWRKGTVPRS